MANFILYYPLSTAITSGEGMVKALTVERHLWLQLTKLAEAHLFIKLLLSTVWVDQAFFEGNPDQL